MRLILRLLKVNGLLIAVMLFAGADTKAYAQGLDLRNALLKITTAADSLNRANPPEKLYLQFDKPYYAVGDTLWFKAWLFNPSYFTASAKSNFLYVDLANDSSKVIKQFKFPMQAGTGWGNINLDAGLFSPGTYTLRAYTNWMRNFGGDCFFYRTFAISGPGDAVLLVNSLFRTLSVNSKDTLNARLSFGRVNHLPVAAEPMQLLVVNNNRRLYHQKYITGVDGKLDIKLDLPEKTSGLAIIAHSESKNSVAVIPVILNRPEKIDVQFLPEGGYLVGGLPAHIGFKAIGEDGKGVEVNGIITDHSQQQVAAFAALHNGMGNFDLTPLSGEHYTAIIALPGAKHKEFPLPAVKETGTVLQVSNALERDSLALTIGASAGITGAGKSFFLVGRARGMVCYAAIVNFRDGNLVKRQIAKSLFPTGIAHFTLMTTNYQPMNDRLVFIDHHDQLNININPDKRFYTTRDSVALKLSVVDKGGYPVRGNFTLAITDDATVKADTAANENIMTRLLLTSDLKGYVEAPAYYLLSKNNEAWQALDNLLLTQGWTGYDWRQVLNPPAFIFQPEKEFAVTGHVSNAFNKAVKGTHVLLLSKSPAILMDTVTDENGKFVFDHFPPVDTPLFVIRAVNKNGKSFNVNVKTDNTAPPDFVKPVAPVSNPWYVNSDSTMLEYAKNNAQVKLQPYLPNGGHLLKEVNIKARKIIKDSKNLNGSGNADWVLDEKELEAAGKKSWLQLLQENIKGFREGFFALGGSKAVRDFFIYLYLTDYNPDKLFTHEWYFINNKPIKIIVDGISIDQIIPTATFRDLTDYLQSHSAEDIKGFEVMSSDKFIASYFARYDPFDPGTGTRLSVEATKAAVLIEPSDISFLEITTRGGQGPGLTNTPGMYLYKPLPLSLPAQFYKPKYAVNDTAKHLTDLRSTIDWEPNIATGINGKAKVFFYTADKASTYTITIEGTDMNGHLGYFTGKIVVR